MGDEQKNGDATSNSSKLRFQFDYFCITEEDEQQAIKTITAGKPSSCIFFSGQECCIDFFHPPSV